MYYQLGIYDTNGEQKVERTVYTKENAILAYDSLKKSYGNITVWIKEIKSIKIEDLK